MDLVSIIVVNFNGNKWLKPCMEALSGQTYGDIEVIVVDNGSTDGSVEELKKGFPSVSVLENEANAGFAQAVNQGIEATTGQYVVPLNPDVVLTPSYVSEMVETANIGPKVGSVSGKLLRSDEKNSKIIDSVGHLMFKNRLSANRGDEEVDRGQYEVLEPVFGTCGAAALYKRGMLEDIKIGGEYFDETFFAFWEDVDLDWRANLMGWTCLYTPRALAYHYRGGIRIPRPKLIEFNNYRNRYFAVIKNDSAWGVVRNLHQIVFTDVFKSGALLLRCPAALAAWFDVIRLLPEMISKRRVIQRRRRVSFKDMDKWFGRFDYGSWFKRHLG